MTTTPTTGSANASSVPEATQREIADLGRYEYGWADADVAGATAKRGLSEEVVTDISARKNEPDWMLRTRLKSLRLFGKKPMPSTSSTS
jgi:Fe-S cluster assembly protein SufB